MRIALASDHAGVAFKEDVKALLKELGHDFEDFGTNSEESCHYPEFGRKAADAVAEKNCERGILVCGTGIGMSLVANKVKGVRAALCHNLFTTEMSRRHNDANVLVLGARILAWEDASAMIKHWLDTPFEGGRHQTRLDMIED